MELTISPALVVKWSYTGLSVYIYGSRAIINNGNSKFYRENMQDERSLCQGIVTVGAEINRGGFARLKPEDIWNCAAIPPSLECPEFSARGPIQGSDFAATYVFDR